jgi:hypothetical protein
LLEATYEGFKGISGIVDDKATDQYNKSDPEAQEMFKWIIFRMISIEGGTIAKRRIYTALYDAGNTGHNERDDLRFSDNNKTQKLKEIVTRLIETRLLQSDQDEHNRSFIEPSHKALLRSWRYVTEWLQQQENGVTEQNRLQLHQSLSAIALLYQELADDPKRKRYLWKDDPRLDQVLKTIVRRLNATESKFVEASLQARSRAKRRRYAFGLSFLLVVIAGIGVYSFQAKKTVAQANKRKPAVCWRL